MVHLAALLRHPHHDASMLQSGTGTLTLERDRAVQVQRSLRAPGFSVGTVWCTACLGPDERHVAAGSSDGTVFIWEARQALCLNRFLLRPHAGVSTP